MDLSALTVQIPGNSINIVALTAIGVGGATAFGALIGFLIKKPSHKFNDMVLSFAAGIMLAAAVMGLIIPSLEHYDNKFLSVAVCIAGIFIGALFLFLVDKLTPHLHKLTGVDIEKHPDKTQRLNKVLLFVIAIAIHNLPEGIAAGVGFGSGDTAQALTVAGGIALQNIPEGMIIISPMLASGMSKRKTLLIALATGLVEVVGTFLGFYAASISSVILPFALAFAGGTMLYVVGDEMIPETHHEGHSTGATFFMLVGFSVMIAFDMLIG